MPAVVLELAGKGLAEAAAAPGLVAVEPVAEERDVSPSLTPRKSSANARLLCLWRSAADELAAAASLALGLVEGLVHVVERVLWST